MKPRHLTRREREILDVLWELGDEGSAEEIRERLPDPPGYSAIRAMLTRLEATGAIRHKEKGLRYVYSPTASRGTARRSALQRLVRVFFGGDAGEAVTAFLESEDWSREELERMSKRIDDLKRERRR